MYCSVTCSLNVSGTRNNEGPSIKPALATKKAPQAAHAWGAELLPQLRLLAGRRGVGGWVPPGRPQFFQIQNAFHSRNAVHALVLSCGARSFAAHRTRRPRGGRRDPYKPLPRSPADASDRDDGCEQHLNC